jgi:hypothetical protein
MADNSTTIVGPFTGTTITTPIVDTTKYSTFESMAGVNTKVIFEFPNYLKLGGTQDNTGNANQSAYILMDSIITLTYSVYRAKMPVIPLGECSVTGFALGNKTIAGTIIKTLTYNDDISSFMKFYVAAAIKARGDYIPNLGDKLEITQKEFNSIMRDDLTPFNIHTYSISEYTGRMSCDSIYGCTIINNGQVQSIENLITENTISFIAKSINQAYDPGVVTPSSATLSNVMTGSRLLNQKKK